MKQMMILLATVALGVSLAGSVTSMGAPVVSAANTQTTSVSALYTK